MWHVRNMLHVFFHLEGAVYAFRDELSSWMKYSTKAESQIMGHLKDLGRTVAGSKHVRKVCDLTMDDVHLH